MLSLQISLFFITIDPQTKQYRLNDGKQIVFHGVNIVKKEHPYQPVVVGEMDYNTTVVEKDIKFMKRNGINFVRLGVMWPGVYPEPDKINQTYLDEMKNIVNRLGENGIYSLIDFHQDLLSSYYCGEGIPDWALPYQTTSAAEFPLPVTEERFIRDPISHKIDRALCLQKNFASYYKSDLVGDIMECLLKPQCNPFVNSTEPKVLILQDELKKYWKTVAAFFKDNQYVVGYDIINEPFPGNMVKHPEYKRHSAEFDKRVLEPFFSSIMEVIYKEDQNHIMFFEPTTIQMTQSGFSTGGPGLAAGIPSLKQSFAFHVYCEVINREGEPAIPPRVCKIVDRVWYENRVKSQEAMGLNAMVNEFGALPNTPEMVDVLQGELRLMQNQMSWAYWAYKPFGDITTAFNENSHENEGLFYSDMSLQKLKMRALFYPYLQVCAGTVVDTRFDFDAEELTVVFKQGKKGQQSEVPIGQLWMGWGKMVTVKRGTVKVLKNQEKIFITNLNEGQETEITFK